MRIYLMTDLEGVAGVLNYEDWCRPEGRCYDQARELLTAEVNAAVDGFFAGGATAVLVADGHGCGGINPGQLDPRVELLRGWPGGWPLGLEEAPYDAVAWVGQHAKSGTELAHLAHTQGFDWLDFRINGVSLGELGQFAYCAAQAGIAAIFAAGDRALTHEAAALVPGIETVAVKRGTRCGRGDHLPGAEYARHNTAAIHLAPERARREIRAGALRAARRFREQPFGRIRLQPPFERVALVRGEAGHPNLISRATHPSDVWALMNLPYVFEPME